jgi:hypothetical protein
MEHLITASYSDLNEANRAVDRLVALHYPPERISLTMQPETPGRTIADTAFDERANAKDAIRYAMIGAAAGLVLSIAGGFAAFGTDFGPWSLGALVAVLEITAGGVLIGALLGNGIPNAHLQTIRSDQPASAGEQVTVEVDSFEDDELVWSALHPHQPLPV